MPKKNGEPTVAESRIMEKVRNRGGYIVQTNDEFGRHFTTMDGKKVASDDDTVSRMIRDGLFVPRAQDGLFPGCSQTFVPRP
jgi:hypothetical protein